MEKDIANLRSSTQSSDYEKDQQITNLTSDIERLTNENKSKDSTIAALEKSKEDITKQLQEQVCL